MSSPVEFEPNQDVEVVQEYVSEPPPRSSATRVIPAIAGGLFAGLLLVGLGCTPLFQPEGSKPAREVATIVVSSNGPGSVDGRVMADASSNRQSAPGDSPDVRNAVVSASAGAGASDSPGALAGIPAVASAASSSVVPPAPIDRHGFAINCDPTHGSVDRSAPRPESATLQGIMASQSSKAALLNGTLYREGDRFGPASCPWTVAMISPSAVRLEKMFGDRVCGVTIHLQKSDQPQMTSGSSAAPTATRSAKPRSATMTTTKSR